VKYLRTEMWMYGSAFLCCVILSRSRPYDGPIPHQQPKQPTVCMLHEYGIMYWGLNSDLKFEQSKRHTN